MIFGVVEGKKGGDPWGIDSGQLYRVEVVKVVYTVYVMCHWHGKQSTHTDRQWVTVCLVVDLSSGRHSQICHADLNIFIGFYSSLWKLFLVLYLFRFYIFFFWASLYAAVEIVPQCDNVSLNLIHNTGSKLGIHTSTSAVNNMLEDTLFVWHLAFILF